MSTRHIIFEVVLHEENTPWAEWDVFWINDADHPNDSGVIEGVISRGTSESFEHALELATDGYLEWQRDNP